MKVIFNPLVFLVCFSTLAGQIEAANFTTAVQQGTGGKWTDPIWQPGGVTPTAGNVYECVAGGNPTRVRNPASGSGDPVLGVKTFPGDSLILNTNTEIRSKGPGNTLDFPGVGGNPGLVFNGGNIDVGDDGIFPLTGVVLVQAPSRISCGDGTQAPRGWRFDAEVRGTASLQVTKQVNSAVPAVELTHADNPFSGGWIVQSGLLKGSSSGSLGSGDIIISATNATILAQLEVNYDLASLGTLTLSGGGQMILHQVCTFSAVTVEGTSLAAGLHSYAELSANFPANFPAGGSGSISVQPPAPPSTPTSIVVINGDGQVNLSWAITANAASYFVKRSLVSGGGYSVVGTPTGNSFADAGLANGATYYYVISATNSLGESGNSVEVVGRPNIPVTGLTASGGTGQVALAWNALAGATGYQVQRGVNSGGPYTNIAAGVLTANYVDTAVQSGRTYFYAVVASFPGGLESGISNEASGTTAPSAPSLSTSLWASTVIRVAWTTSDPVVSQFNLEQSTDGVNFVPLATLAPNERSYTNSGLALNTTYHYRVQAQNATGFSDNSVVASSTTPTFGVNVNFANAAAPIPLGYLQDIGNIFGDRGNGFSYGWDRDITADGRWRQAANSPDLRYDTFMHLIKATPPAIWNIAIPNGFYSVHVVAGDPANTDSVFQFNIEGVFTATVTPGGVGSFNNYWADFTVTCAVSDGQLTLASGPNSQTTGNNNKVAFIDIYAAVPVAPVIGTQPVGVMVEQNRPISLTVGLSQGSTPFAFQWYLGDNPVPGGTSQTLTIPHAQFVDAGNYQVVVTNYAGVATSSVAAVTVMPDSTPPVLVSATSLDGRTISVCFSEEMDDSADEVSDFFNYTVTASSGPATVVSAQIRPDGRSATLQLTAGTFISGAFSVTAQNMKDLAGLSIAGPGATANNVVAGFSAGDVGGPGLLGSHFSCDGQSIEIVGGGADVWGNADQFYLLSKDANGDFDARVRVTSLRGSNAITKAVLVARESIGADSRSLHVSLNPPPPGRDLIETGLRSAAGGATAGVGGNFVPAGVPNAWMRITRLGDTFNSYRGSNGMDWALLGSTTQTFPATMVVGIGVTAHDNTLLATGVFSNFQLTGMVTPPTLINPSYSGGMFSASFATQSGVAYSVLYKDALEAPAWSNLLPIAGDGTVKTFTDSGPPSTTGNRFYRVASP